VVARAQDESGEVVVISVAVSANITIYFLDTEKDEQKKAKWELSGLFSHKSC
jgi:hypothetical protein